MRETILKIEDLPNGDEDGFLITTTEQTITLAIDNGQSCCEDWGYFMSNDDIQSFVGAQVLNVTRTDVALHTTDVHKEASGSTMFVNIETSLGTLQFVAYNDHNGYYGHEARVQCNQLSHTEYL